MSPMTKVRAKNPAKANPPSQVPLPLHLRHPPLDLIKIIDEIRLCGSKYEGQTLYF